MTEATKTILIVDDEADLAESYALRLDDRYETKIATSGGEALTKLGPDVDLVLLDRRMAGDGRRRRDQADRRVGA